MIARRSILLGTLGAALAASTRALADGGAGAGAGAGAGVSEGGGAKAATQASGAKGAKAPSSTELDFHDIQVAGDRALGRRFLLCVPKHLKQGEKVPLVVLLHGLGETGDERTGVYAWVERYGLATAYERLRKPPIARTAKRKDWTDARLGEVNASLAKQPFGGLCLACPYTPNVHKLADPSGKLDAYAKWIAEVVVPRARKDAPVHADPARTAVDGCSLGGYVALEVFLRRPDAFGAFGGVQAAVSAFRAPGYADRIAAALAKAKKPMHLLTSEGDPFLPGNRKIAAELGKKGVACDLRVLPGPHDQPWLREAGTIEALLWHDRRKKSP